MLQAKTGRRRQTDGLTDWLATLTSAVQLARLAVNTDCADAEEQLEVLSECAVSNSTQHFSSTKVKCVDNDK